LLKTDLAKSCYKSCWQEENTNLIYKEFNSADDVDKVVADVTKSVDII